MEKKVSMLDKDFDKLFGEKLGETQSFHTAGEDWEQLVPRLEKDKVRVIPYKAYLVAATVAMLLLANGYTLYRLNHSESQLQDIQASLSEQSKQIIAVQDYRKATEKTSEDPISTNGLAQTVTTITNPITSPSKPIYRPNYTPKAVATTNTKPTTKPLVFADSKAFTMPKWSKNRFNAPKVNASPRQSALRLGLGNPNHSSQGKEDTVKSASDLTPYQKALLNKVLDYNEIQQAKKQQIAQEEKKTTDAALALDQEKHLIEGHSKKEEDNQWYSTFSLAGVNIGTVVGAGLLSNKFMQSDRNEVLEGSVNAGLRVEFDFSGNLRLYSDLEYMNINRWTTDFSNTTVPDIESPGPEYVLDAVVLNQTFYQYTLGMKYFIENEGLWQPFIGSGFSSQLAAHQKYKYNYYNANTGETAETDLETNDRSFIYNTVNINAGVEYNLSRDFMMQLEGYYNTNIKKESASIPNLYGVKASILYNI